MRQVGALIGRLHTEDKQRLVFLHAAFAVRVCELHRLHLIVQNNTGIHSGAITRIFGSPDNPVRFIIQIKHSSLGFPGNPAAHIKAFCLQLRVAFQGLSSPMAGRISLLIINPVVHITAAQFLQNLPESHQILLISRIPVFHRRIGRCPSISKILYRIRQDTAFFRPAVDNSFHPVFPRGVCKCFSVHNFLLYMF